MLESLESEPKRSFVAQSRQENQSEGQSRSKSKSIFKPGARQVSHDSFNINKTGFEATSP